MLELKEKICNKKIDIKRMVLLSKLTNVPVDFKIEKNKIVGYVDTTKIRFPKYEIFLEIKLDGILGNMDEEMFKKFKKLNLPTNIEYHLSGNITSLVEISSNGSAQLFIENATLTREINLNNLSYVVFKNNKYMYPYSCHYLFSKNFITTKNVETIIFQNEKFINHGEKYPGNFGMSIKAQNVCIYDSEIESFSPIGINIDCTNISLINSTIISNRIDMMCNKYVEHSSSLLANEGTIADSYEVVHNFKKEKNIDELNKTRKKLLTLLSNRGRNGQRI